MQAASSRGAKHCNKCRRKYHSTHYCPHPAVQKVYGETICYWCCKGCKYAVKISGMVNGIKCGYTEEGENTDNM